MVVEVTIAVAVVILAESEVELAASMAELDV